MGLERVAARVKEMVVTEEWNVGVVKRPVQTLLAQPPAVDEIQWLTFPGPAECIADPFGRPDGDGFVLVAERVHPVSLLGEIVVGRVSGEGRIEGFTKILPLPVHMSYPSLIEDEGELFCVPETARDRTLRLYRATDYPTGWELDTVLIEDFALIDPTIFRHDGRWWMLGTNRDLDSWSSLHAWSADALRGPWLPHPGNPVASDRGTGRPAGPIFTHEGRLYRPAQDCSQGYGGAIVLCELTELTPDTFAQEPVQRIVADPRAPYQGFHHLCGVGEWTLLDGRRRFVSAGGLANKLRRKLRHRP